MKRATQEELTALADELLVEWYNWSSGYRPDLDVPGCTPACRNARTSRQYDTTAELTRDMADLLDLHAVEYCYNELSFPYQNAIGIEMKNRQVKAKVWRSTMGKTYAEAVEMIIPIMHRKNLL